MRPIDADRLNAVVNETLETLVMRPLFSLQEVHLKTAFETLTDMINDAPTIDAVPVVRCKNCRWWDNEEKRPVGYCHAIKHGYYSASWEISIYRTTKADFYCADGEEKDKDLEDEG